MTERADVVVVGEGVASSGPRTRRSRARAIVLHGVTPSCARTTGATRRAFRTANGNAVLGNATTSTLLLDLFTRVGSVLLA